MRLMNSAGNLEELGEYADGAAESVTRLQTQLLNLTDGRVDIMASATEFRSTFDILYDLSSIWESLTGIQQSEVTRLVAGVRQGQVMAALMGNMANGARAAETALNSYGSAARENEIYLRSLEGRMQLLSTAIEATSASIVNAGLVGAFVDLFTGIARGVGVLDGFVAQLVLVPVAIAGILGAGKTLAGTRVFANIAESFRELKGMPQALKQTASMFREIGNASASVIGPNLDGPIHAFTRATEGLTDAQTLMIAKRSKGLILEQANAAVMAKKIPVTRELLQDEIERMLTTQGMNAVTAKQVAVQTVSNAKIKNGILANKSSIATLKAKTVATLATKNAFLATAAAWALTPFGMITIAVGAIAAFTTATRRAAERAEENARAIREQAQAAREQNQTLREQITLLSELNEARLNSESFEESRQINLELLQLQYDIVDTLGLQRGEIDLINKRYEQQVEMLNDALVTSLQIEQSAARTALSLARQERDDGVNVNGGFLGWGMGEIMAQLNSAGIINNSLINETIPGRLVGALASTGAFGEFEELDLTDQISTLRLWVRMLEDAEDSYNDMTAALLWAQGLLSEATELQRQYNQALRAFRNISADLASFNYENIVDELLNIDRAALGAQGFVDEVIRIISQLPGYVQEQLGDNEFEIAATLGIDIGAVQQSIKEATDIMTSAFSGIDMQGMGGGLMMYGLAGNRFLGDVISNLSEADLAFVSSSATVMQLRDAFNQAGGSAYDAALEIARLRTEAQRLASEAEVDGIIRETAGVLEFLESIRAEYAEIGRLSTDTFAALINLGDEFADAATITADGFMLNADALDSLSESKVEAAIVQSVLTGATEEQIATLKEMLPVTDQVTDTLERLGEIVGSLSSAYNTLTSAIDEFNEHGDLQASTILSILQLGEEYRDLLIVTEHGLKLNTDAIYNKVEALREEMIASRQAAFAEEVRRIVMSDLNDTLQDSIENSNSFTKSLEDVRDYAVRTSLGIRTLANELVLLNRIREDGMIGPQPLADVTDAQRQAIDLAFEQAQRDIDLINMLGSGRNALGRSGTSSGSASNPFIAEIEATRLLEAQLANVNELLSRNNELFTNADGNVDEQARLIENRILLLEEQRSLMMQINNIRFDHISDGIAQLGAHGIVVTFDPVTKALAFEQPVEEINRLLNNISSEDARREMYALVNSTISLAEAANGANTQILGIGRALAEANMELLDIDFARFTSDAQRELAELNFQMSMFADDDFVNRIQIASRQVEHHTVVVARTQEQMQRLSQAYADGVVNTEQFIAAQNRLTDTFQQQVLAKRSAIEAAYQLQITQRQQEQAAMDAIVNMTKQMIRQEIRNQVDDLNNQIRALGDMERDLNDALRDRNDLRGREIDGLRDLIAAERERARIAQQRLRDELDMYRHIIGMRRRNLSRESEDRRFEQELTAAQMEVQRIEDRLAELARNDSLAATAERRRLEEELARRQQELDNLIHRSDVTTRDRAYQDELDRFQRANEAEQRAIADALRAFELAHQARIDMIDAERAAHEAAVAAQIEDIRRRADAYREMADQLQDSIARNGDLVRKAFARIKAEGEQLYRTLILWNDRYGSAFEETVLEPWNRWLQIVDMGNNGPMQHYRSIMQDILHLTQQIAMAQQQMSMFAMQPAINGTLGVRNWFESQGHNVGWNQASQQFSIGDTWFDAAPFYNLNGSLQATHQQLLDLERRLANIPSFDIGGRIHGDTLAVVHQGEHILTAAQTRAMDKGQLGQLVPVQMASLSAENFGRMLNQSAGAAIASSPALNNLAGVVGSVPSVHIDLGGQQFHGVTSESFMRELPSVMRQTADVAIGEFKREVNNKGKARGIK